VSKEHVVADVSVTSGFVIGLAFGAVGLLSGFCLLSSVRDWWTAGDGRKIRSYALALAVAILGAQVLATGGLVDLGKSLYLQPSFSAPLLFAGGLLFGFGMVLSNGCVSRALVLLGKGNLRSLVVLVVVAVAAQMALKGLLAPARVGFLQWSQVTPPAVSVPAMLAAAGLDVDFARMAAASLVAGALVFFAFSDRHFRAAYGQIAAGVAVGLLVTAGWFATGWLAADDFAPVPVTSLTFVSPVADTVQYTMLSTALSASFGIALVAGVITGSALTSLASGRFKLEGYESPSHMLRSISGAALMGIGGAMAYGCSVGQGLTGLSTLALPSLIAAAGILAGAALGLRGPVAVPRLATR
jgi:uncharacterized membrane protein YedE/YeeE